MALYKYVTAGTAVRILKGSIRFTQPGAFNDPFELLPQFLISTELDEVERNFRFCMHSPRRTGLDRKRKVSAEAIQGDFQARKIVASLNDKVGILCLSKNHESLLMWAHYADEYAGAVVEFDESHEFFQGPISVKYQTRRPVYDLKDFYDCTIPLADLCVKSNVWSYEREVRLIRALADCKETGGTAASGHPIYAMDVPIEAISGVILGGRMNLDNQKSIWNLVKDTNIALCHAAVGNWEYGFMREPIKFKGPLVGTPMVSPRTALMFIDEPGPLGEMARWVLASHPMMPLAGLRA